LECCVSFEGSGYLLAPFAGSVILLLLHPGPLMLIMLAIPLAIAFLFYLIIALLPVTERREYAGVAEKVPLTFLRRGSLEKSLEHSFSHFIAYPHY